MDGSELYELFAQDADIGDLAKQDVYEIARQIGEFRPDECEISMSHLDIARAIHQFAREHVAEFGG